MQAVISALSFKPFIKGLTCLSRFGDDLTLRITPHALSISAHGPSKSAYGQYRFSPEFFSKYAVNETVEELGLGDEDPVVGQLSAKALLPILKHKALETTLRKCELELVLGIEPEVSATAKSKRRTSSKNDADDEYEHSTETCLIVKLHCQHGVIKTHRIALSIPTSVLSPHKPDASEAQSTITVGPQTLKDLLHHFPEATRGKETAQLVWHFGGVDVKVRSLITANTKAKGMNLQLSTEIAISADEFDHYDVPEPPVTLSFHLREFTSTIQLSESLSLPLTLNFTQMERPLFITIQTDSSEAKFIISTNGTGRGMFDGDASQPSTNEGANEQAPRQRAVATKRARELADTGRAEKNKSRRVGGSGSLASTDNASFNTDISFNDKPSFDGVVTSSRHHQPLFTPSTSEPLFFASQLSQQDQEVLQASGLGLEKMTEEEVWAMVDDDDDGGADGGFGKDLGVQRVNKEGEGEMFEGGGEDLDMIDEGEQDVPGTQVPATQWARVGGGAAQAGFTALFDD